MLDNLFTPTHLIIVLVIALLIFGPRKLPELGKGLGEGLRGFKDGIKGGNDAAKQEAAAPTTTPTKTEVPQAK
jgi:sec-independent protein translocase protein TatA